MTSRLHQHSTLPPAVISATHGNSGHHDVHSKSHVLAGVQDAYWSDDEAEDAECPLCLEEMDISDVNFKPCPCGYQICRFCWHHIKENLNGRCPACRREYTDEAVQFKPIEKADHKRLTQQKKQRERERKELDALGRRHLANLRVVQRNVVYVVGIGPRFAKEELIPTLRSNEYFGQYGKISKMILVKKNPPGRAPVVGLYITYHRREDAARAIAAVDGTPSPGGGNDTMRASYGTTKYCMAFLRGVNCTTQGCMDLHEWGDERDCFTKEDLTTLKHTIKDSETRTTIIRKDGDAERLPRSAAWGSKPPGVLASTSLNYATSSGSRSQQQSTTPTAAAARGTRRGGRGQRAGASGPLPSETRTVTAKAAAKAARSPAQSRPTTPAPAGLPGRPTTPASTAKIQRQQKEKDPKAPPLPIPSRSAASSPTPDSESGSWQDVNSSPVRSQSVLSVQSTESAQPPAPSVPPGIPTAPPGIPTSFAVPPAVPTAPPGLPPMTASQSSSSYQMSMTARALLNDLMSVRHEQDPAVPVFSPFPDFDRTLQVLRDGDEAFGGFSFNLDPKVADNEFDADISLPPLPPLPEPSLKGSFMDVFPAFKQGTAMVPPQSTTNATSRFFNSPVPRMEERQPSSGSSYTGSFNPFSELPRESRTHTPASPMLDDEPQRVSRFGFARARRPSSALSSSPMVTTASLMGQPTNVHPQVTYSSEATVRPQWNQPPPNNDFAIGGRPLANTFAQASQNSTQNSPFLPHVQAYHNQDVFQHSHHQPQPQQQSRFQPFDENMLKEMIGIGRDRPNMGRDPSEQTSPRYAGHFNDPAIMSLQRSSASPLPTLDGSFQTSANHQQNHQQFGPPPGLAFPPSLLHNQAIGNPTGPIAQNVDYHHRPQPSASPAQVSVESTPVSVSPVLSSADFPALVATSDQLLAVGQSVASTLPSAIPESELQETPRQSVVDEKARKQAEAKLKAEQRREEKAVAKAVRKAALKERRDREAEEKAEREAVEKEAKAARDKLEKERAERERAERAERERVAKLKEAEEQAERLRKAEEKAEKERALQAEKEARAGAKKAAAENARKAAAAIAAEKSAQAAAAAEKTKQAAATAAAEERKQVLAATPDTAKTVKTLKAAKVAPVDKSPVDSVSAEPTGQAPLLSKMPKKQKTKRTGKEIDLRDGSPDPPAREATPIDAVEATTRPNTSVTEVHRARFSEPSLDPPVRPASIQELLEDLESMMYHDLPRHPFFDALRIAPNTKLPLDYIPLVHALSALSVGGGSFATAAAAAASGTPSPSGSQMPGGIDNAVSSFQQLLETLTQTISDLLRLLPRTTWDDSTSFDGVLRDMLKGDDFLDDGGVSGTSPSAGEGNSIGVNGHLNGGINGNLHVNMNAPPPMNAAEREDEVAALTLALERRARWMEVQLAKLEELHRDINMAAVRAVLAFSDRGWDVRGALPRRGGTLARFDQQFAGAGALEGLGMMMSAGGSGAGFGVGVGEGAKSKSVPIGKKGMEELEKRLSEAKEKEVEVEGAMHRSMEAMQKLLPPV